MKRKVMLVYTGGTIGMKKDYEKNALVAVDFNHIFTEMPELNRINCELTFKSFKKPIDSSDMKPELWIELAEFIESHYNDYDGFVVLHGSDTMAYTASALSFLLENLNKAVVLTGSQLPIGTLRTDGKENLITAIEIAGAYKDDKALVPEVSIYFEYHLYRGNRSSKVDADQFKAFETLNYPLLAKAGIDISYNYDAISKGSPGKELLVHRAMSRDVSVLMLFPGIRPDIAKCMGNIKDLKGLVIETYGSGNAPSDPELLAAIKDMIDKGIVVLNVTQCHGGTVNQKKYKNGQYLSDIGVISGKDLTTEAALTKMMFLFAKYDDISEVKKHLEISIRGELTEH